MTFSDVPAEGATDGFMATGSAEVPRGAGAEPASGESFALTLHRVGYYCFAYAIINRWSRAAACKEVFTNGVA